MIHTHGAAVFLAGDQAYKIKRPVKYAYLDFSTLEKRRHICERELELNQPSAPEIYLGLTQITREEDGSFALNGTGKTVEWAVHMRRFETKHILDNYAKAGKLDRELAAGLASRIADYHKRQTPIDVSDGATRIKEIIQQIETVFQTITPHLPNDLPAAFVAKAFAAHEKHAAALDSRAKEGMIRHCHGDLHLQNIVLINGTPTLFDALEFDDRLATIDCLYDLAFLLMDLNYRGLRDAANTVISRYALEAWPLIKNEGFSLLPLFMALRAAIRAMVAAEAAEQNPDMQETKEREAATYLKKALRQFNNAPPRLYAIGGLSGTGKSTLSAALSPTLEGSLGAIRLRSDVTRKVLFEIEEFSASPEWAYTPENIQKVYDLLEEKATTILRQGQSVLLDAVFSRPHEREAAHQLADGLNIPFTGLWLEAPADCLYQRVNNRKRDASDADSTVVEKQLNRIAEAGSSLKEGWIAIDASGSPEQTLENAKAALKTRQ